MAYIRITENGRTNCLSSSMVQNIPGMIRTIREAQEMQEVGETLISNVAVRLGALKPISNSEWVTAERQSRTGQSREAIADMNVDVDLAVLSDWFIGPGRTEVCGESNRLIQCYQTSLENGQLNQERFAANLFAISSVSSYDNSEQKAGGVEMQM